MTDTKKIPSWLTILLLTGLGISVGPHQVMTRTDEVSRALSPVLSSFELIRMAPGEIERQVRTTGELRFRFNETDFYFNLEPHDLRAPGYRAVETGSGGVRRTLARQPVHTFKGVLAGREDTRGRFNLTDGGVEGVIYSPEVWYYVEPLRNYLPRAQAGELVVYRHSDIRPVHTWKCGVSLPERLQREVNRVAAQVEATTPINYVVDVATEADYEYVQALGGSAEANREILGIMNQVAGVYQSELLLQLRVSFQHTWATEDDPYTATTAGDLLTEFTEYWNTHYSAKEDFDIAHLWTDKEREDHTIGGLAQLAVACRNRALSYGLSQHQTTAPQKFWTPAHEIGHNFGAVHPNDVRPRLPLASWQNCFDSIMWWTPVDVAGLSFCNYSREQIASHVLRDNGCLTTQPITLQPPTQLKVKASTFSQRSFSRIDLTWQDNSSNEAGFIVQRQRTGWGWWTEIGRTAANATTFSNPGLFPGATYMYQVQAFNESEYSAFSNEVQETTVEGPLTETHWWISTIAGTGDTGYDRGSYSGDGGPAVAARLNWPTAIALDGLGNLYIADTWNHRIRRVDATGTITTIAGTGEVGYSGDGGPAVAAQLNWPAGMAVDGQGNLYFADGFNHRIRRIDATGIITTIAGTGEVGYSGDGGSAVAARLNLPGDVAIDGSGNLYITDTWNHRIRRVDATGMITTIAGTGEQGYGGDGGPAVAARLEGPVAVAVDGAGKLYITDKGNRRIRRVDATETIATIAGVGPGTFNRRDGPAAMAALYEPIGLALDESGSLYIADTYHQHIRRVDTSGTISTIAGFDFFGPQGAEIGGFAAGGFNGESGPALEVGLDTPIGLAVDGSGNVYVADGYNHRVRILTQPPSPPTRLTATPVSSSRVKLNWQDNSANEKGFRIERRASGTRDWAEIGNVASDVATFLDEGLKPLTAYHYRVAALGITGASAISNEAQARTLAVTPPTLTGFSPTSGPVGTRVNLTGTKLFEATSIELNGVNAPEFEIRSGTSIEVIVPPGATSGSISVVAPGGRAVSADPFTVTTGIHRRLFVPIVLRSQGRSPGSFFTSELTLTNRGTTTAAIHYTYTAAFGGGSGSAVDTLEPSRQRVIPDAISYLASLGVAIGSGSAGGTLAVDFSNLSSPSDAAVTVRVATLVEEGRGRAGLAYMGLNTTQLANGAVWLAGLRQTRQDRSNVAVQNAGAADDGSINLRVTVYSGNPGSAGMSLVLPDRTLPPGGFHQYNGILSMAGFENGYVKVERVDGTAPYYAYGVINDNINSDGSFVFPVTESSLTGASGQTLPVIIETRDFATELTVTNFSPIPKTVDFRFVAEAVETNEDTARFSLELEAGEQRILPGVVDWMREQEVEGIGAPDEAFVGALFASPAEGEMSGVVLGARTGSPDGKGGQYSLFYNGVPYGAASTMSAWIYGLQQNEENRSNLALVNTGEVDGSEIVVEIDIYNGEGDSEPITRSAVVGPRRWHQLNGILGNRRQGYIEVRKTTGNNPFVAYGVINDGARRGHRSGDGAFLPSQE